MSEGFHCNESNFPIKFNILQHKDRWIACLKSYMNLERTEKLVLQEKRGLSKKFYHILYQYYMIKENTHFISEEAKNHVQKIHDLNMPSSYFYELKELINQL